MASIAGVRPKYTSEHKFFLTMAIVMAAIIVAGFSVNVALGRSTFASPLIVHVHAFVFFGWVALYVLQNALVTVGSVQLHKRLGWLAVGWVPAMVVLAVVMTLHSVRTRGGPPFLDLNEFLIGNSLGILYFAGMVGAAILMRRRTAWHRRLMYCGMTALVGPGIGRLLPMPFLIPWGWWVAAFLFPLIFSLVGIAGDLRRTGRVHPAWWWGVGVLCIMQIATDLIAYSPVGYAVTRAAVAGTPGAERDFAAHFP
jgi:hypothetical protein